MPSFRDPPPPASVAEAIEQARGGDTATGTARERVPPAEYDAYAQTHGVAAGRWAALSTAWQARMTSDWRVGAKMGEALEAAKTR